MKCLLAVLLLLPGVSAAEPTWPEYTPPESAAPLVAKQRVRLAKMVPPSKVVQYRIHHDPDSFYMARGVVIPCKGRRGRIFDNDGIPLHRSINGLVYHPGAIQLCAFALYYAVKMGFTEFSADFLTHMEKLLSMQDEDGAFRHPFRWKHTIFDFPSGWVSGLNQGKQLSLNVRAYHITGDERYLESGKRALEFMLRPIEDGGTLSDLSSIDPSLSDFIFIEEFPDEPPTHVLNGAITAMVGLYDWSHADIPAGYGSDLAGKYFDRTVETLKHLLPYYEVGGMTAGDLRHVTRPGTPPYPTAEYHLLHSRQMTVMYMLTGDPIFKEYEQEWIEQFAKTK